MYSVLTCFEVLLVCLNFPSHISLVLCGKQPCVFGGCGLLVFLFLCLYFLTVLVILLSIYISTISIPDLYGGVTVAKVCFADVK
jgi:hypothetical protein